MLKRCVPLGLVTGFLIALALLYPVATGLSARYIPNWENPPATVHRPLQLASLAAASIFFVLGVITTALLVQPRCYKVAIKAGALSGTCATFMIHLLVLSPAEGMIRMRKALRLDPLSGSPSDEQLAQYASHLRDATFTNILAPLLFGAIMGGLVMASVFTLYHLVRYKRRPKKCTFEPAHTPPNLLKRIKSGRAIRWPDPTESTWQAGLLGGLLLGTFAGIQFLFGFSEEFGVTGGGQGLTELLIGSGVESAMDWLSSLTPFLMFFWGAVVIALQRTPSSRYWARVWACTLSGGVTALAINVIVLNNVGRVYTNLVHVYMFTGPDPADPEILPYVPRIMAGTIFGAPLAALFFTVAGGLFLGFMQGLFFAWIVPLIPGLQRPVDVGRRAYKRIRQNPTRVLPVIWELFREESEALDALAHLTIRAWSRKDRPVAQVAASYHTSIIHPEATQEAVETMVEVLQAHPKWRWRAEIGEMYRLLQSALQAREAADIAIISPPPEERTSSLPKPLTHALDHMAVIIRTLKKYERVDDLGGRILFLNNALGAIDQAQEFVRQEMHDPLNPQVTYPEKPTLEQILSQWQTMILDTIRGLRGRAELTATLETRRLPYADTLHLEVRVTNVGLNVAEDVWVQLVENQAYQPVPERDAQGVEILLPGDGRSLEFSLTPTSRPAGGGDLRVLFELRYNDSVDPDRTLELADSIAFLDQLKPFQRIFPIPYVTGTPLRTSDMFVGRGEVLQFIREHLLGAYQNNVIVLHGQRRTGKTSILYQLQRVLQDTHVCVLVDMQGKAARGLVDFLYSLADDITYALEEFEVEIEPPERQDFEASPEFFFRSRFLRQVAGQLNGRSLLLMFDEFEELQARVESGKLEPDIFPYLRNLMQHEEKADFIFAGTHKLEELATEYWSILFNIATYKKISFLAKEEVNRLITTPVAAYGLEYDPLAVRRIYEVTAGQPYFVQLVCHELVAYHNETERNYLTTYDVETVLGTIIERGEAHFKYIWAGATPQERWVLLGAAEHLAHAETITFAEMAAWLRLQEGATPDAADLPDVLAALERRDILTRTSPTSRRYRFKIDLVRRWIAANRQLRESIEG